jgi:hypothetical protein
MWARTGAIAGTSYLQLVRLFAGRFHTSSVVEMKDFGARLP